MWSIAGLFPLYLSIFVILPLNGAENLVGPPPFRSDYQYVPEVDGWLKLHQVTKDWIGARAQCKLEGAVLASPLNPAMFAALNDLTSKISCEIFTGISSIFSNGDFHTIEGIPLDDLKEFVEYSTARGKMENCMTLGGQSIYNIKCEEHRPFVCYKKNDKHMDMGDCSTVDKDYSYNRFTNSCYKLHLEPKTWHDAYSTCSAERAHLVILNHEVESIEIRKILHQYDFYATSFPDIIHAGYHVWSDKKPSLYPGFYMYSIHGQTLEEAGFTSWEEDNPNGSGICGGIYRDGKLNDNDCSLLQPFICEKAPDYL